MKYTYLALTGLFGLSLASCDKSAEQASSQPDDKVEKSVAKKETAKFESVNAKPSPEKQELQVSGVSVSEWKQKASKASEMDEIKMMKDVVKSGADNPEAAVKFLVNAPHSPRRLATLRAVTAEWVKQDREAVMAKANELEDQQLRDVMRLSVVHNTSLSDVDVTKAWINSWDNTDDKTKSIALDILDRKVNPETPHVCGPECEEHVQ